MGDVVLGEMLRQTPHAQMAITDYLLKAFALDVQIIVADESVRHHALSAVQALRAAGIRTDYSFNPQKVGKQFQSAEDKKARYAVLFGSEYPQVEMKNLIARSQKQIGAEELTSHLLEQLNQPAVGPLIA